MQANLQAPYPGSALRLQSKADCLRQASKSFFQSLRERYSFSASLRPDLIFPSFKAPFEHSTVWERGPLAPQTPLRTDDAQRKKKTCILRCRSLQSGARSWTRTNDPLINSQVL
ncbi:protein of unknown function [Stenotrophomonas maltophilia]|nr:protein of unknown function [Stenotrophomonas maltophilia]